MLDSSLPTFVVVLLVILTGISLILGIGTFILAINSIYSKIRIISAFLSFVFLTSCLISIVLAAKSFEHQYDRINQGRMEHIKECENTKEIARETNNIGYLIDYIELDCLEK